MNWTIEEERILSRMKKPEFSTTDRWAIALLLLFILCTFLHFAVEPHIAVAAQEAPIYQNDHYCELIRDGVMKVVGAEGSITKLCAKEGVTL